MIGQISSHLMAIEDDPEYNSVYGYENYIEQYKYLAFAESEALLRFPDTPQAEIWRWDVCYNLALSYSYAEATDAPELLCYAKLIGDGINSGQTNLSKLPDWFQAHESRFSFEITSLTPPQGYTSSNIIMLEDNAFLLLLEKDGKFQATGLMSSMFFFRESGAKFQFIDLTGDKYPELVLYFGRSYCCGAFSSQFVYDISSGTPKRLAFANLEGTQSKVSSEYDSYITKLDGESMPGLLFESHYGDPLTQPCDLRQYEKYYWNNNQFELAETWYGIEKPDEYEDQELCQFAIDTPSNQDEINVVAQTIRPIFDRHIPGFRQLIPFRLGEYYARLGNYEKAFHFFSDIATTPSPNEPELVWTKAAQTLLDHYKTADDFYKACSNVPQCDTQSAVRQAIENLKPDLFPMVGETLRAMSVPIKDSGVLDFDADGEAEQWIVVQHPGKNQSEFWVLVKGIKKNDALFVADISSAKPEINRFEMRYGHPITELNTPEGKILFSLEKMTISAQPYISLASPPWNSNDKNEQIAEQLSTINDFWRKSVGHPATTLFNSADPVLVRETLLGLKQSKNYGCKTYPCDQLYYFLGLANELADDKSSAVDAYLQLWKEYPDSPYTIMARSKLELKH